MNWFAKFFDKRKQDLADEIDAHLQMEVTDRISRGETPEQAKSTAAQEFGNVALISDVTQVMWNWTRVERVYYDLRFGVRTLSRSPGFALTIVLTLALGIGATCAMFTVVDRLLLQPLPYRAPDHLVHITAFGKRGADQVGNIAYPDIAQWQQRSRSFESIAFDSGSETRMGFMESRNKTSGVSGTSISANLFPTLGIKPAFGRTFFPHDPGGSVTPEDAHALLLSDAAWREDFDSDPQVLGTTTHLNGEAMTIIGVMPPGVFFPFGSGHWNGLPVVWRPIVLNETMMTRAHNAKRYHVVARLESQVSLSTAQQELRAIQDDVAKAYTDPFDRDKFSSVKLERYSRSLVDESMRKATLSLFAASTLLWLIAGVNAGSLMFARATGRQREFAVRAALGASRSRILQQLLGESAILSVAASVLGLGLAFALLKAFERSLLAQFNIHELLRPDLHVAVALILLTAFGTVGVAVWPAFGVYVARFEVGLKQGSSQAGIGRSQQRTRVMLVVTEISLALTLLVGCGLLLRSIYALRHVSLGFRTQHVVVADMTIPGYRFTGRNMTTDFYQPLMEKVKNLPGVQSAALLTEVPLGHTFDMIFTLGPSGSSAIQLQRRELKSQFRAVGPEAQQVFGFRMFRGRFFDDQDTATSEAAVVVNRAFVRAYFGDDRDPSAIIGENLVGFGKSRPSKVIGVLDDQRQVSVSEPSQPEIEVCIPQITPDSMFYSAAEGAAMDVAIRTFGDPSQSVSSLRRLLRDFSPDLAGSSFATMDEIVDNSLGGQKLAGKLLAVFAGAALLLTLAGIYGVLGYFVSQGKHEIGVRIALGAQRSHIYGLILRQTCWMLGTGIMLGSALAYLTSRWLNTFLYGVKAHDPLTGALAAALLFGSGILASLVPSLRAASVNPVEMLRAE